MRDSYMSYAMSVIMSRALPDLRDGLKPVHRRILYAMSELNLSPEGSHRKCAKVVGEVLGKFHPHGDQSVYDALVRMAQPFSLRAPLVDGHGNFGSNDPDPPAAMRYTECKLQRLARDSLLTDVALDTVDFTDNFDASEREPMVLPARLPMLLLNGASGIAATNIPPHNLGELVDALQALISDRDVSDAELLRRLPGPDFPTGGIIMGNAGARDMYTTGRGSVVLRSTTSIEALPAARGQGSRQAIIVTELPYGTAKNPLLEKVAALVNAKTLVGISDIRDESSLAGTRVVFELRRDADPLVVLNQLFKKTELQKNFPANWMAVEGPGKMPARLTLRSALSSFLDFRVECVRRRTAHLLAKAEARLHLVDGLLLATQQIDAVIEAIRGAPSVGDARELLTSSRFGLSPEQAEAILSLQLRRLTALEQSKLDDERADLRAEVARLSTLLSERSNVEAAISAELEELREAHATPRRSAIEVEYEELSDLDLTPNEGCVIVQSARGFVKRMPLDEFEAQGRGTRGKAGMANLGDGDAVLRIFSCATHDTVLFISERGIAYALEAFRVPVASRTARGVLLQSLLPIAADESIAQLLPVSEFSENESLVLLTRHGWIKRTPLLAFERITARGLIAASLGEGDCLTHAAVCTEADTVIIASRLGQALRFNTDAKQLRASGRASRGVKSMRLRDGDEIADMDVVRVGDRPADAIVRGGEAGGERGGEMLLAVTRGGYGKRVRVDAFQPKGRGGQGMISIKFKNRDDRLVGLSQAREEDQLLLITKKGVTVRQAVAAISEQGRAATGVQLQRLDADDYVASAAIVPPVEQDDAA
ncbi:DNA topoisomerase [Emiliania huxleyi CCMP1516]|uniref:DNA topoisomerase (ATP-hydrolyzing) n=2 Tax=Emiliania huxleyi TaxID=2903 RepID=A0A0D3JAS3_EMIH1|nr:DNA topoisomerase [Emiliania huxleyi CCMP1516]XP_005781285.1 DNA topoisomerase [Emiliania huxleyi CCMP1516]EOD20608.1 DNA topoisomerase [Emiliania huxleyi CCMP1516]EOD28856.1 DNA topoisomerase [Emiliania huxleyi CCMP1516]|eukprot:XP_005773037.1 DNA topoisomerase [Emiliania huxleyi CCMP1516]